MPLMPAWASSLVADLSTLADAIGLINQMDGEEFETRLGQMLAFQRALPVVDLMAGLGPQPPGFATRDGGYANRFKAANRNVGQLIETLRKNLFDNFGLPRIDTAAAAAAYSTLHRQLGEAASRASETEAHIAYTTTNYDCAIEVAVDADPQRELVDGFTRGPAGWTETLNPSAIAEQWEQRSDVVPVLHLLTVPWAGTTDQTAQSRGKAAMSRTTALSVSRLYCYRTAKGPPEADLAMRRARSGPRTRDIRRLGETR